MSFPKIIFIIPYRDRIKEKNIFELKMKKNLIDLESYKIYYIHQQDKRIFNRGALKNIGFIIMKKLYPNYYKDITFVFHDIDIYGNNKDTINYDTNKNIVKHFYGYKFALGGIVSIKGSDFELIKGYPNYWGWGFEDNMLYDRCISNNLKIDRTNFFHIGDKDNITHYVSNNLITYNKRNPNIYKNEKSDTLFDIKNLEYHIIDNMINITYFTCKYESTDYVEGIHNINLGNKFKIDYKYFRRSWSLNNIINL